MKTRFLLLLTGACALGTAAAIAADGKAPVPASAAGSTVVTTNTPTGPAAKIEFDSTTFKFEKIKQGEAVKHSFIFTNTGNVTLQILDVKPGCGCTTAGQWDKTVEPGATGAIPLQFNSAGFGGIVAKSATVTCNDPVKSNVVLVLTGNVWRPIDFNPSMAMFQMESEDQTNQTKTIRLVSNLDDPLTISNVVCTSPSFKTELKEVNQGRIFELQVTAIPPFTNTTYVPITLLTSSTSAPSLSLSAYVTVQQQVVVSPQQFFLPPGPFTNTVNSTVTVLGRATQPLRVSEPVLALPGVEVDLKEVQTGRVFTVSAKFPAGFKLEPGQRPELTLKTDHPKFPLLKVPLYQQPPPVASLASSSSAPGAAAAQPVTATKRVIPVRNPPATVNR
jgi:hypothetical protein